MCVCVCVCLETPLGCHFAFAVCILLVRFLAKFCRQSSLKLNAGARWSQRWLSTVCCLWMTCRVGAFFFIVMNYVFSNMSAVDIFIKERAVFMWAGKLSRHNFAAHSRCQDKPFIGFWQTRTHTLHTHPFNGTTRVSRYQKGKTSLDFTEARDSEWQWHQLGHMQVCITLQTDNHASTPPLSFLQAGCPSCHPTNSVKALKVPLAASKGWMKKTHGSHA